MIGLLPKTFAQSKKTTKKITLSESEKFVIFVSHKMTNLDSIDPDSVGHKDWLDLLISLNDNQRLYLKETKNLKGWNLQVYNSVFDNSKKTILGKSDQFIYFEKKKTETTTINVDKLTQKQWRKLMKVCSFNQAKYLVQKDLVAWWLRVYKGIATNSLDLKKEFNSINRILSNFGAGIDYRPIIKTILEYVEKNGNEKERIQAIKVGKHVEKVLLKKGYRFVFDNPETNQ